MSDEKILNYSAFDDNEPDEVTITLNDLLPDDEPNHGRGRVRFDLDVPVDLSDAVEAANRSHTVRKAIESDEQEYGGSGVPAINLRNDSSEPDPSVIDHSAEIPKGPNAVPVDLDSNLLRELETLKNELKESNQNYLRAVADLQNFRRRGEEERRRIERDGNERLIKELLPVMDDFERALELGRNATSSGQLIGGVEAILRKFTDVFEKEGVKAIPALGESFNPDVHEAVMLDEGTGQMDETVTAELRRGYLLNDKVIRPSLVKVAKS